ncbi:DUF664 domain-containing protein [Georgenia faecalis]|uniref:DUF664 domain-containing protein n=1 Tax=Georgenia faecalis TaxID=2483799 RepID=A0ABV9D8Z4_9MICO|nr:DUF664 domain-containing protein [Georgenia faecalis]
MTETTPPWEPPMAGTEAEQLIGSLERLRTTFRWKADGLDAAGLQARVGASALTLGSLLKHLAVVEDDVFSIRLRGEGIGEPWESIWAGGPDWPFTSAVDDAPEDLYGFWDDAVERSRARLAEALAAGGLDQPAGITFDDGRSPSVRRLLCDLLEEYGRHTGHADLLRESVDGRVGEDAPPDWRPVSGRATLPGSRP